MSWHTRFLAREAILNITPWSSRGSTLLIVAVLSGVAATVALNAEGAAVLSQLDTLNARGRNVLTVSGSRAGQTTAIDRAACERLAEQPDIARAGVVIRAGEITSAQVGTNVPVVQASATLFPELRTESVLLGANLPAAAAPPRRVVLDGAAIDSAPLSEQPEGVHVNQSVVTGLASQVQSAESCIAVLEPRADPIALIARVEAAMTVTGTDVSARPTLQENTPILSAYRSRTSQWIPLGVGLLGAGIAFLVARSRSREYAAYRLTGASRVDVVTLTVLEQTTVALSGLLAGLLTSILTSSGFPGYPTVAAVLLVQTGTSIVMATAATLPTALTNPARLTRSG